MDVVAHIMADLMFSKTPLPPSLNVAHPRPIPWSQMIKYVQVSLKRVTYRDLRIIPFHEWMLRLEAAALQSSVDARDSVRLRVQLRYVQRLIYVIARYKTLLVLPASEFRRCIWKEVRNGESGIP